MACSHRLPLRLTATVCAALLWAVPALAACSLSALNDASLSISASRPVRFVGDITKRATARAADSEPFDIKVRRAEFGAQAFNNEPRYELAAYQLQRLLLAPDEDADVVPPAALRSMPVSEFRALDDAAAETFRKTGAVLFMVQCWLAGATPHHDEIDLQRFAADLPYARAVSNVNVLTYLIEHKDSNAGNIMLTEEASGPRAWSIDNGVAFAADESNRGTFWRQLRVPAIDRAVHERLRAATFADLERRLGVVAQFSLIDGNWVPEDITDNFSSSRGVRREGSSLQLGLTRGEIRSVHRRLVSLVKRVESGKVGLLPEP
jgi:hypothetical protein